MKFTIYIYITQKSINLLSFSTLTNPHKDFMHIGERDPSIRREMFACSAP